MATVLTGFVLGSLGIILEIRNKSAAFDDGLLKYTATANFLHCEACLFAASCLVMVAMSVFTPPPSRAQLANLTMGELNGWSPVKAKGNWRNTVASVLLVLNLPALWWVFR